MSLKTKCRVFLHSSLVAMVIYYVTLRCGASFQCEDIILGGDFNLVLSVEKDKKVV